jgi:hypothetical protein
MDYSKLTVSARKLVEGDRVAILSPSLAAPGLAPAVHEQAMRRLTEATGLIPVEFPTTRKLGSRPQERAADINAAFADPSTRAILATVGGDDQITVIPHLDKVTAAANPKIFIGYSDNPSQLAVVPRDTRILRRFNPDPPRRRAGCGRRPRRLPARGAAHRRRARGRRSRGIRGLRTGLARTAGPRRIR